MQHCKDIGKKETWQGAYLIMVYYAHISAHFKQYDITLQLCMINQLGKCTL